MKSLSLPLILFLLFLFGGSAAAETAADAIPPVPPPPQIAAKGYLLVDFSTGQELAAASADDRLEPASLTKIMTAYTIYREL